MAQSVSSLTYVWIGGSGELRMKVKFLPYSELIETGTGIPSLHRIPEWIFDGSSTGQATMADSDVFLKPVRLYHDPFSLRPEDFLVLCATFNHSGKAHPTNHRAALRLTLLELEGEGEQLSPDFLFGVEQEYMLFDRQNKPYGWLDLNNPGKGPSGVYYCSVGGDVNFGRQISDRHARLCLDAGIKICGTNSEVVPSQWEYQIGPADGLTVADDLWMSRFLLQRVCEEFNCWPNFDPKPLGDNWNGSGLHTNVSTKLMREPGGYSHIIEACRRLAEKHREHIAVYGSGNERRLTGKHETSSMEEFSWSEGHRGKSIRIPLHVVRAGMGYFEDRRPAANADAYLVIERLVRTLTLSECKSNN